MRKCLGTVVAVLSSLAVLAVAAPANAAVAPGSQTYTEGAQCTANFIFRDASATYVGQAAHCSSTGSNTETDGCRAESLPLGTPVEIEGATKPGTLAYNSWITMQRVGEQDPNTCLGNDFALVKLDPADAAAAQPTVPFFGGPTGLRTTGTAVGDSVFSYQNSSLRFGVTALKPKRGTSTGMSLGGWRHNVYTVTPGVPGDSGSGFLDAQGRAFGVLSVLEALPRPASNGVSDLAKALEYARAKEGVTATLVTGGPFSSGRIL
jgi:hypothetical protein